MGPENKCMLHLKALGALYPLMKTLGDNLLHLCLNPPLFVALRKCMSFFNVCLQIYELGVREGLFLSKYQRSLYNVDRLRAEPWWTPEETTYSEFFKWVLFLFPH
jgi:hypothetical protein